MQTFKKVLSRILGTLIVLVAVFVLFSFLPIEGNYEFRIVESGSMEPTIDTGSVVAIISSDTYQVGDVITFRGENEIDAATTHRIVEVREIEGQVTFLTQGDANDNVDFRQLTSDDIIGKVFLDAPFVGYVSRFMQTPGGFWLLVLFPSLVLIGWGAYDMIQKRRRQSLTQQSVL